jgi:hypothetical protein
MCNLGNRKCFVLAPEICVDVLSPRNTQAEMREKTGLYFDAGAQEVWLCSVSGERKFMARGVARPLKGSPLPEFSQTGRAAVRGHSRLQ